MEVPLCGCVRGCVCVGVPACATAPAFVCMYVECGWWRDIGTHAISFFCWFFFFFFFFSPGVVGGGGGSSVCLKVWL